MNYQNSQQNSSSMHVYVAMKSILRKFGRVCAPITNDGQAQVDYFVVNDYDGLQLNFD